MSAVRPVARDVLNGGRIDQAWATQIRVIANSQHPTAVPLQPLVRPGWTGRGQLGLPGKHADAVERDRSHLGRASRPRNTRSPRAVSRVMRAVNYSRYGGIDVLGISDLPVPHHGPLSVLVRVVTAAINPVDYQIREGWEAEWLPAAFPMIPGIDVAGVVAEIGADTPGFAVGDAVIAHAGKDFVGGGTLAEYTEIPVRNAASKPAGLSWEQAATLPVAAQTALQTVRRSGLDSSSTVLIHAASGGVGSFATQLAVRAGARVIGSASPRNHDYLRGLGAEPIDYHGGLVDAARSAAPGGFDVILDCAGQSALDSTPDLSRAGGTVVSIADFRARDEFGGIFVWENPNSADLAEVGGLAASGQLDTDIAAVYELDEFADAFALLESGSMRGKIIIRVSTP